jgi:hypothetical protein
MRGVVAERAKRKRPLIALVVNRLPNVTLDRRSKKTPGEHPFVWFGAPSFRPGPCLRQAFALRTCQSSRNASLFLQTFRGGGTLKAKASTVNMHMGYGMG